MKIRILTGLIVPFLILVLAGCTTTKAEDVDDASKEVQKAQEDLDQANKQYEKEVAAYRLSMETDLRNNKLRIAKLKEEKLDATEDAIKLRNEQIETLQKRNDELESRINGYESDDEKNWKAFKKEFNHDMNELGKSFKDLGKDNVK